jgi:Ala-tRNA(Pro) deacylase
MDIEAFLRQNEIDYQKVEHPPVYTCEEAQRLAPPLPGAHTKNLFLRDAKGRRHVLLVVGWDKQVDLKALAGVLEMSKLGMASAQRLQQHLGVEPGAVTLLALANDTEQRVEVVVDAPLWQAAALQCHPLVNTATLSIAHDGIERFLERTGHPVRVVEIPSRDNASRPNGP